MTFAAEARDTVASGAVPPLVVGATNAREVILLEGFDAGVDTVFWIASMTKPLVAAAAMILVEQGRLLLDSPIGTVLPELAAPLVLEGFDDQGAPILRPARRAVTLRNLLTHTSGFCYDTWHAPIARYIAATGTRRLEVPLAYDPGERWHYGTGIDWVGRAIMAVSGQRLDLFLRDHVLDPLGMHDTGYVPAASIRVRLAGMHRRQPDGALTAIPFAPPEDPATFTGGGGLYGTVSDYLRFVRMMLCDGLLDGVQLLQAETIALMAASQIGELPAGDLTSALPEVSNDVALFPGVDKGWGLSFLINRQDIAGRRSAGSLAWAGLFNTYFWIDRNRRVGGAMMTQLLPFADPTVLDLFDRFEATVYGMI
jgi:CubicO group peptidase (beta-lactamase class C family)